VLSLLPQPSTHICIHAQHVLTCIYLHMHTHTNSSGKKENLLKYESCSVGWYSPIILSVRKLRQKDYKFEARQDYIVRPCLKKWKSLIGQTLTPP
jgi:hypothetical protein